MKKVLIVIQDMESGGGQRSLLSFLRCMEMSDEIKNYDIDVMVVKPTGIFYSQIPTCFNVITSSKELLWLGTPLGNKLLMENFSIKGLFGKIYCYIEKKWLRNYEKLNDEQRMWLCWKGLIPYNKQKYDIAISYMNGFPNYYVIDKVSAKKKVLWIHNEYTKLKYDSQFDSVYYDQCDQIITISKKCEESLVGAFPQYSTKIAILENITMCDEVLRKGNEGSCKEYVNCEKLKLLSIGRLEEQKGFDYAIEAAKYLKDAGVRFLWLIIGEGNERSSLQKKIEEYELTNDFRLIGIRYNPYVYIKECDIFVQSSRFEGKSIVLDEAKIFCKPIVVTNYPTVYDSIVNRKNGLIVEMSGQAIGQGIIELYNLPELAKQMVSNLKNNNSGNEQELEKYVEIMFRKN